MSRRSHSKQLFSIGSNIESLRRKANLSLRELARESGIGLATISDIENSKATDIKLSTLFKLAKALNVSVESLILESQFQVFDSDFQEFESAVNALNHLLAKQLKKTSQK